MKQYLIEACAQFKKLTAFQTGGKKTLISWSTTYLWSLYSFFFLQISNLDAKLDIIRSVQIMHCVSVNVMCI